MNANGRREATERGTWLSTDALLQASRRVDWRFLLPDPNLGQVAYIGPAHGTLLASLRLFSKSLTVVETGKRGGTGAKPAQYDVVVVSDPTATDLQPAVELLRPGGWLYLEAYGPLSRRGLRRRFRGPRFARDYVRLLQQLGMDDIEAYWHWPDFESCTKIIPLGDRAALSYVLAPRRHDMGELLRSTLGHGLLRSGLLTLAVPCFSVVGAHLRDFRSRPDE